MKILFFTDSLRGGGKERRLGELIKGLVQKGGYEIEIISMDNDVHYNIYRDLKIPIHFLIRKVRWDLSVFLKLLKICRNFKPDIIHTWDHMTSIYALPIAKLLGIKFINGMITTAPHKLSYFNKDMIFPKISMPFSDIVLANSKAGLRSFKAPHSKSRCIYNGFDFKRVENLGNPIEIKKMLGLESYKIIGMVASFTIYKDYKTFIDSASLLLKKRQEIAFVSIGDGPDLEKCKQMVNRKFNDRFKFLGQRRDVESICNIFDIGVLTTNVNVVGEGVSNSIMEYMAVGKPVIATNSGGTREIVNDKETGFLISGNDVKGLTEKIEFLLDNIEVSRKMGETGMERIHKYFDIERMVIEFIDVYSYVLKK